MKFDDAYQDHVCLSEVVRIRFRLVQPADKQRLRDGFAGLSAASRQKRFLGGKRSLSEAEISYLTELDQLDHFAIGAVELDADGEERDGVGIARFIRLPNDTVCAEVAITVIDRMQGRGLGRSLLTRLVDAAQERGIERFRFECLAHNQEIRKLVQNTCTVSSIVSDSDVIIAEVELPARQAALGDSSVEAFERLFTLLRTFASDALEFQFNAGMSMVRHSFDLAFDKRRADTSQAPDASGKPQPE